MLVGSEGTSDRGGAFYAIVREPGVDRDVTIALALAGAYASAGQAAIADKAKSWIVEVLTPLATHPAVTRLAVRALNEAVVRDKIDARRLAPQYKHAVITAYFSTLMAMLYRFGKINEDIGSMVIDNLPVTSLTVKAALSVATMPTALDASAMMDEKSV
jgi:hypothetical protein